MLNIRHNLWIAIFFLVCAAVVMLSLNSSFEYDDATAKSRQNTKTVESYFKSADYYLVGGGRDNFHLYSDELIHNQTNKELILTGPNGVVFNEDGEPIYYSGGSGFFDIKKNKLFLKQSVILRTKSLTINSDELVYDDSKKLLVTKGNVFSKTVNYDSKFELRISSDSLSYFYLQEYAIYSGNVQGKVERFRRYEPPFYFNADKISLLLKSKTAKLDGNVSIKKQQLTATSRSGEVFLENYNKKLKYFALYDDVIVKEKVNPKNSAAFERKAFSEKLEGFTSEEKIVLLGYPKVYQRNDVLKGNMIILRENNETIEVDDANTNFRLR